MGRGDRPQVTAPRVLICDKVAPECLGVFEAHRAAGGAVRADDRAGISREELLEVAPVYQGIIVRSRTRIDAEVLARAGALKAVVRAGVGVDNIDLAAATERGVLVMNCPGGNTAAAAEHSIALVCALARNVAQACAALKRGEWAKSRYVGTELAGKVLGVVGLGKVGRHVVKRARGLGMRVVGTDPFVSSEAATALEVEVLALEELLATADFVSLHVPLTEGTRGLFGEEMLARMKTGARLVNVARGGIVDEAALAAAIERGHLGGAALDVFAEEPPPPDHPLLRLDQVIVTPHLGASTAEAQEAVGTQSATQLVEYLARGVMVNAVNTVAFAPELVRRLASWRVLAERLGSCQAQLREAPVSAITVRYAGELFGSDERKLLTLAFLQGFLSHYVDVPVNYVNARMFAKNHGVTVNEARTSEAGGYGNRLETEVELQRPDGRARRRVAGTVYGESHLRIVGIDDYLTDALPEGDMLLVSNDDTPGIVGTIGSALGRADVNIGTMTLGRDGTGGTALAILNVDSPVSAGLLGELEATDGILWVRTLRL